MAVAAGGPNAPGGPGQDRGGVVKRLAEGLAVGLGGPAVAGVGLSPGAAAGFAER